MNTSKTRLKKFVGIIVSVMLVVGSLSVSAFAGNNGTITANNIEAGATVKAYKIVGQNASGEWVAVKDGSIADPLNPTAAEITALAGDTSGLTAITMDAGEDSTTIDGVDFVGYSKEGLEAGMYLVLVEDTDNALVYNPMIISVNYDDDGALEGGSISADSNFQVGEETAYAKSTKPTIDKKITGKTENGSVTGDGTTNGDTLAVGDDVSFEITTTIPAYSALYDNDKLKFEISDTLSSGLDPAENIKVFEGETELTEDTEYTLSQNGNNFTISFAKSYLLSGQAKDIKVTYDSKLNENATSGFDANTNTAEIEYSNTPDTTEDKDKTTYKYTFDIDGNVFGDKTGKEIKKVGVDATTGELITLESSTTTSSPLSGAEFTLYKTSDDSAVGSATTDGEGLMNFTGLDAGEYYLVETKAPAGYKTNSTKVPVKIEATLNADGTLASYSVTINGQNTTTYTGSYEGEEITVTDDTNTSLFNNYKAGVLPSTGGDGIYFYIITGAALICLAILLYTRSKKNENAREDA